MPMPTPDEIYRRWRSRMQESAERYRAGINRVTTSPMEKAANAADAWVAGVQNAARTGIFQGALRAVTLEQWKEAARTVGAQRLSDGAVKAERKFKRFWTEYGPVLDMVVNGVRQMPKTTYAERRARALALMDQLHENPYRRRAPA